VSGGSYTIYRFRFDVADLDRGFYEPLDFRLALHPSETHDFLLTRALAYALNFEPGLEFSASGLSNPEEPCLSQPDPRGGLALWIEVGNPSARRLHKAAKAARRVCVYTYKNPKPLLDEMAAEQVHRREEIEVYPIAPAFLADLTAALERDNEWNLVRQDGSLTVTAGEDTFTTEIARA
jgi:uncharacterized protein YaeQ